jgi:hypothetical protein
MDNYKFTTLLEATPISEEDRYNLATIFRALSDMRKQDIIDHWDVYLSRILEIHNKGEVEKKVLIASTFQHINTLIDEAYMREQERKKLNQLEAKAERKRNARHDEIQSGQTTQNDQKLERKGTKSSHYSRWSTHLSLKYEWIYPCKHPQLESILWKI